MRPLLSPFLSVGRGSDRSILHSIWSICYTTLKAKVGGHLRRYRRAGRELIDRMPTLFFQYPLRQLRQMNGIDRATKIAQLLFTKYELL